MNIIQTLQQLRDDIKTWVTNNIQALNQKIDSLTIPVDKELNNQSLNPVQNKTITEELEKINTKIENTNVGFTGEYSDIKNAPDIVDDGSGDLFIIDPEGNIIMSVNNSGFNTTAITANDVILNNLSLVDSLETLNSNYDDLDSQLSALDRSLIIETWMFTLDTGDTITKRVVVK